MPKNNSRSPLNRTGSNSSFLNLQKTFQDELENPSAENNENYIMDQPEAFHDIYKRHSYYIHKDVKQRLDQLVANGKKQKKRVNITKFVNYALEQALNEAEEQFPPDDEDKTN